MAEAQGDLVVEKAHGGTHFDRRVAQVAAIAPQVRTDRFESGAQALVLAPRSQVFQCANVRLTHGCAAMRRLVFGLWIMLA